MGSSAAAIAPSARAILSIIVFMSLCPFIVLLRDLPVEVSENLSEMEKL